MSHNTLIRHSSEKTDYLEATASAGQSFATGENGLTLGTIVYNDCFSVAGSAPTVFTAIKPGLYYVQITWETAGAGAGIVTYGSLFKNSTQFIQVYQQKFGWGPSLLIPIYLDTGDTFSVSIYKSTGGTITDVSSHVLAVRCP